MIEVVGIDHINIAVSDLGRSEPFYDRVLLEVLGSRKNKISLSGDPHVQHFNRHFSYVLSAARSSAIHAPYAHGLEHFCLRVNSIDEVVEIANRLQNIGIEASAEKL